MNHTTDPENTGTPGTENAPARRRRWVFPAVLAIAVTGAVGALAVTAYPGTAAPADPAAAAAPASTVTPTAPAAGTSATVKQAPTPDAPVPPAKPGAPLDNTHAKASLHNFLGAVATIDNAPAVKNQLATVASGAILDELGNEQLELDANGWTQHGQAVVDNVKVLKTTATTATVQACIDSSDIELLDNTGTPIPTPDNTNRRALNIYTLTQTTTGTWQVTNRTFPDNPTC